jgi:hypothetical protein
MPRYQVGQVYVFVSSIIFFIRHRKLMVRRFRSSCARRQVAIKKR